MDHEMAERLALLEARVMLLEQSLGMAGLTASPEGEKGLLLAPSRVQREIMVSVSDLSRHEGEDFIRVAYLWLLRKEADDEGIRHYLHKLDDGVDKRTIIIELAAVPESQAAGIQLIE